MFVRLTRNDDAPLYVNLDNIMYVREMNENLSEICLAKDTILVKERPRNFLPISEE